MSIIFKTFRTYAHPYVYDRHTNAVVMLTEDEYKELVAVEKGALAAENSAVIKRYQEQGLFQSNIVQKIEHSGTSRLEPYLKTRMRQLTLQVTQQCNLRCEYCVYSGIYDKNRTHSNKKMSFETAKKAIDYFMDHNTELAEVNISFYGGEPLLEFDLIKQCVSYAKSKVNGKRLRFNMTTNGTLLNDKIVDYIVEHEIHISVSLDGSKEEHDKSRRFRNGQGSFDTIIGNIRRIRERYPEFDKNIRIMTTINPHMDLSCVMEYFSTEEIFGDKNIMFNAMNSKDLNGELVYKDEYYLVRNYEYIKCLFSIVGKLDRRYVSKLTEQSISNTKKLQSQIHEHTNMFKIAHHNGPCMPGVRKLFVNADGRFYPCERVNETQDYLCIGSIDCGVCVGQSKKILNIGQVTEELCKTCWALRHCSICVGQIEFDDEPTIQDKIKNCAISKSRALADIKELCVLNEFGIKTNEVGLII